ncbi:MAG: TRAP transporter substrate-binding protein [Synergistaceae bacterium]|nr:TRAP transporter substrate-binding protein [Synergistaceae bacterium]MBR0234246.1 TRAP transporter substrate-binding protein [Synergistaceae bacterium]MBR0315734.1 TRAP transporter substrate-binding protein [Synergistaceae bacterium]
MKKKLFAALVFVALFASVACALTVDDIDINNPNTQGSEVTLGVNHVGATTHPYQYGCAAFAKLVHQYTDGKVGVTVYPASQIASGAKAIEFVQMGTLDMCLESTMALENFVPEDGVLNLPFLFSTKKEVYTVLDGPVGDELKKFAENYGFKILCWMDNGFRDISNKVRPLTKPEDFKGIKLRTPESPVFIDTFTQLGSIPTAMAVSEVFSSIQLGIVDGQENPSSNFINNKYYEVNKYYTISHHIYTAEPLMIGIDRWEQFDDATKEAIQRAANEAKDFERQVSDNMVERDLKQIKEYGVEINEWTPEQVQVFKDAVAPIYEKYKATYGDTIAKIQEAVKNVK